MITLTALLLAFAPAHAHPTGGQTSVVVVMKMASCSVCVNQLTVLAEAELGAPVMGITHDSKQAAARVTAASGVTTTSHPVGIESMGLWLPEHGIAQPAVVVYDRCGAETGRVVGRRAGLDVTEAVRALVQQAQTVHGCGRPSV